LRGTRMKTPLTRRDLVFLLGFVPAVAVMSGEGPGKSPLANQADPASGAVQPMGLDEPMPTGMGKEGMKKGDVMKAEKQKRKHMEEMMQQEKAAAERGDR
jgi:hypothetical protein